jgi:PHD/YefM family antitoxin component YafN of YafNO toxin-antitoxin module
MLDINRDIDSLTNFKRNTPEFLRQLKKTGEPVVLTINGKAELVVQDSASYQKLMEIAERAEELELLRGAIEEMKAGKGRPIEEMFDKMESLLTAAKAKKAP